MNHQILRNHMSQKNKFVKLPVTHIKEDQKEFNTIQKTVNSLKKDDKKVLDKLKNKKKKTF